MSINKFGISLEAHLLSKSMLADDNDELEGEEDTEPTLEESAPSIIFDDELKDYINGKIENLTGNLIFYINVGPAKDNATNYLKLSTGGYEYEIHIKKCRLELLKSTMDLKKFIVHVNGSPIQSVIGHTFIRGDKIAIKAKSEIKGPLRLIFYVTYPIS